MTKSQIKDIDVTLDSLGDFGKFQITNYVIVAISVLLSGAFTMTYVFTAGQLEYRCKIPECDNQNNVEYTPKWLVNAVPYQGLTPSKCQRYQYQETENNSLPEYDMCNLRNFDTSLVRTCDNFVYKTDELTIVNEFNIHCNENEWKLSMVGSANSLAQFIFMPIAGILSDRFGRRTVLIYSLLCSAIFGLIRSYASTYIWFVLFEFIEAGLGVGTYSAALILGMELVGSNRRVFTGLLAASSNSFGGALLATTAMYTRNFRILLRILYAPAFLSLFYGFFIPESLRWLMINGHQEKALAIIRKATKNKNPIIIVKGETDFVSEPLKDDHHNECPATTIDCVNQEQNDHINNEIATSNNKQPITINATNIFKSKIMMTRVAICSACWVTNTFVYFGLSLNVVTFDGNKYVNFILVVLAEIPSIIATYFLIERLGRRLTFSSSMLICGLACIATSLAPNTVPAIGLSLYILAKCSITISFTVLYVYTAELFPTSLRHSLLSFCSMIGRIGAIMAPQTPLLARFMESLPLLLFSGTAIIAGLMSFNFPETLNTKLPDSIEDAEMLGENLHENLTDKNSTEYTTVVYSKNV